MIDERIKKMIDNSPAAVCGGVYEFLDAKRQVSGLCIVIGGEHRMFDRYVSIIRLKSIEFDGALHGDEVGLKLPDGREFWVHCGMLTYVRRDRIGRKVYVTNDEMINRIYDGIKREMGMISTKQDDEPDYKQLYQNLIKTIADWNKKDGNEKKTATRR